MNDLAVANAMISLFARGIAEQITQGLAGMQRQQVCAPHLYGAYNAGPYNPGALPQSAPYVYAPGSSNLQYTPGPCNVNPGSYNPTYGPGVPGSYNVPVGSNVPGACASFPPGCGGYYFPSW